MKQYTDGWYKIEGYNVYVENGRVMRGASKDWTQTLYPYVCGYHGGMDNASGRLTPEAFRGRVRRGTACMR